MMKAQLKARKTLGRELRALNTKLWRDGDDGFKCQVGGAALNTKLKMMKAPNAIIEN